MFVPGLGFDAADGGPQARNEGPIVGYVLMYDPAWAVAQPDTLWNEPGDKIAQINDTTKARTCVVWNPLPTRQPVDVYENGKAIGRLMAAPQALTGTTAIYPPAR